MVISKNSGKRKKKEIVTATESSTTESPKRTKVHAQRKFAQGQGQSSSSSLFSLIPTSQSQQTTPVKDSNQPTELLPNLRPNTEDFLTFLCFRGTSVLPSHLDYLNTNKRSVTVTAETDSSNKSTTNSEKIEEFGKSEEIAGSSSGNSLKEKHSRSISTTSTIVAVTTTAATSLPTPSTISNNVVKTENQQVNKTLVPTAPIPTTFIPFAVRKNAETVIEGKRRQAVQALKKKYQEQRMAKTKLKTITARPASTATTVITDGRKTRSAKRTENADAEKVAEETQSKHTSAKDVIAPVVTANKKECIVDEKKQQSLDKKSVSKTESICEAQNSRRISLRNSSNHNIEVADKVQNKSDKQTKSTQIRAQSNSNIKASTELLSVHTELDSKVEVKQEISISPRTRRGRSKKETFSNHTIPSNVGKGKELSCKMNMPAKPPPPTIQQSRPPSSTSSRTTRQKSSVSKITNQQEDIIEKVEVKLSDKPLPNQSADIKEFTDFVPSKRLKKDVKDEVEELEAEEEEFSSDDDEPLVKTIKKSSSDIIAHKQIHGRKPKKRSAGVKNVTKNAKDTVSLKSEKSTKSTDISTKRKYPEKQRNIIGKQSQQVLLDVNDGDQSLSLANVILSKNKLKKGTVQEDMQSSETGLLLANTTGTARLAASESLEKEVIKPVSAKVAKGIGAVERGIAKANEQRKRKIEVTDLSHLDQSENEARTSSRPMRKTKTAAAIYMELIGQKLNLGEFDDDNYSMDSFPELPNVRKTEQMENELKANIGKEKFKSINKTVKKMPVRKPARSTVSPESRMTEEKLSAKKITEKVVVNEEEKQQQEIISAGILPDIDLKSTTNKKKRYVKKAEVDTAESLVLLAQGGSVKKLEKSFSDSDDEPLAVKATKRPNPKVRGVRKKSKDERPNLLLKNEPIVVEVVTEKNNQKTIEINSELVNQSSDIDLLVRPKAESINFDTIIIPKMMEQFSKPSVKLATTVKVQQAIHISSRPYQDSNALQLLSPTINLSPIKSTKDDIPIKIPTPFKNTVESILPLGSAPSGNKSNTTQAISSILANLMPSKEESGKIFGIASVSLAQSSGPNDTKCTLGKCGSIHKPPLGPVVPTETFLLNDQMSSKERRKAKVNMTHEQIQKWLTECSDKAEYPEEDFLDDDIDLTTPPKPINYMITPSPFRELIEKDSALASSSRMVKQKAVAASLTAREKFTSIPKGPSLKAKPVVLKEDRRNDTTEIGFDTFADNKIVEENVANVTRTEQQLDDQPKDSAIHKPIRPTEKSKESRQLASATMSQKEMKQNQDHQQQSAAEDLTKKEKLKSLAFSPKTTTTTPTSLKSTSMPAAIDKKPIYNQKRTPVYNTKITEATLKPKPVVNSFGAFSPENEPSIYSFDKEEDTIPTSTPFRRHGRRESSSTSKIDDTDRLSKKGDASVKADKSAESTPKKSATQQSQQQQQQQAVSLTLSPEDNSKSASIAVQVSMDVASLPKPKPSGDDSDSEGHTFYIPLQGTNITGSKSDQLIQGVAVKLGTEGPEGPNQRVIMHAKLVTKAQMGSNTTPIPEAMANVHEIVKSLIVASKDASSSSNSKSVPVGTVQPRFKSSGDVATTSSAAGSNLPAVAQQQSSGSGISRQNSSSTSKQQRYKYECTIKPSNNTVFPRNDDPAQMVEALTFRPTDKEFHDPIEFIERITPVAARFGLCRIIPPAGFKPECNISDDMRFRAYNLYVHKMLHRWGPSAKELSAIKQYLATQRITLTHPPWIGGMEVDLPRLYHTVQELGGLKEVIEKKKWPRVAEEMCIPKSAQDRVTKLDDIYCKYLLPYDTLSPSERQKLFDEVEADWAKAEAKARRNADRSVLNDDDEGGVIGEESEDDDDDDVDNGSMECIVKGRSMPLSAFFRIARNTMALWFKNTEPTSTEVETEFWRHVAVRDSHVCVHSGSIDSSGRGYGFPAAGNKAKAGAKHPWNLKVLTNNQGSILRSIGPVTGVTVPTLHVGMLFSACCWYRDPHGLPWIEYLHTGGSKIWYGVPDEQSANFRAAFTSLVPTHCQNKTVWLPCDTAMVPPHMLTDRGVSLCRTEQEPGQFVIVFPRAYTSSLCTGYSISESVYFATNTWLNTAEEDFKDIHDSCEPAMFSLEQLLFAVASDIRTNNETLTIVLPMITKVYEREIVEREKIKASGVTKFDKVPVKDSKSTVTDDFECDTCRANLYISWVKTEDDNIYCLQHGLKYLTSKQIQAKDCKLITTYTIEDIVFLINKIKEKSEQQQQHPQQQPQQTSNKKMSTKRQSLGGNK